MFMFLFSLSITKVNGHKFQTYSSLKPAKLDVEAMWVSENKNRHGAGHITGLAGMPIYG